ncbi:hypothetical protein [Planosporangium mesophilum]|uniref:Uncharacterized protein n=1 Tax=Planosporangium mesophilum TaxID=689768 RepID=A0A8J3TH01_9ACTN|nr:hypothetical protein [Planosporangium mesophilum]NJC83680.1 hypothetical protein [Planosporangium mesophilum]GII25346.1 hypothetical protein Pme01_49430 [Planosporangium mesophilum]
MTAAAATVAAPDAGTGSVPVLPLAVGLYSNPVFVLAMQVQYRLSRLLIGTAGTDAAWLESAAADLDAIAATGHRDADLAAETAGIARTAAAALRGWS